MFSQISEKFGSKNSNFCHGLFNITKCFIGLGILACPTGFKNVGLVLGIIGILLSGVLNYYTIILQQQAKKRFLELKRRELANDANELLPED